MPDTTPHDPYRNFNFILEFDDRVVAGCKRMSGLSASVEPVRFRAGEGSPFRAGEGSPTVDEVMPGRVSYEPVTLESGLTDSEEFQKWASRLVHREPGGVEGVGDPEFRREVTIAVKDLEASTVVRRFQLHRAWVSKYTALSDLVADGNEVLIESIQTEHEGFTQVSPQD